MMAKYENHQQYESGQPYEISAQIYLGYEVF